MSFWRHTLGHALIVSYFIIVALGTAQAVKRTDYVPIKSITIFMYGMLAPYQGHSVTTEAFLAEGFADGEWREIDLAPYYPVLTGERSMREWHVYANWAQYESNDAIYRAYAEKLRALEAAAGREYEQVRLSWIQWKPTETDYRGPSKNPLQHVLLVTIP